MKYKSQWCMVKADGKVIFEGYRSGCERLVKNLKNSERHFLAEYEIIPMPQRVLKVPSRN